MTLFFLTIIVPAQVLLLLGSIASTPRPTLGQAAPKICLLADEGKQFCSDCMTPSKCLKAGDEPVLRSPCSEPGEACTVLLGKYAVCKSITDTPCTCGEKPTQCDAYDPDSLFVCLSGGITTVTKCKSTPEYDGTCIDSVCGTAPTEEPTVSLKELCEADGGSGFVPVTPDCTSATYCQNGISRGTTAPCDDGQYYDIDELECLPAPPQPCPVSCGTGACSDKGDCSKWYICDDGTLLDEEICTGDFPEFDSKTLDCVAEDAGNCPKNNGCDFDLITTTVSSTMTSSSTTSSLTPSTIPSSTPSTTSTSTSTPSTTSTSTPSTTSTTTPSTTSTTTPSTTSTTTPSTTSTTTPSTTSTSTPPTSSSTSSSSTSTSSTSSTTNHPSTCGVANVGMRYPIAESCKKYLSCRRVGTNLYAYVEGTCLGSLVFNAETSYCDTLANVPGCVPPS